MSMNNIGSFTFKYHSKFLYRRKIKRLIRNSVNLPACPLSPSRHSRLTVIHGNVSGLIAKISSILSDANINIEEMVNKSRGEIAYSVFDLNEHPSDEVMAKIAAAEGVRKVRCIR